MKKPTKQLSDSDRELVILNLSYWGKFVLPVDAATQIMTLMVRCGAEMVESGSTGKTSYYYPKTSELVVRTLDQKYLHDCPPESAKQKEYFAWLKTKSELVGDDYELEAYADYLNQKLGE